MAGRAAVCGYGGLLVCAEAGLDVLVLEKGPRHDREAYDHETGLQPGDFVPSVDEDPHTVVTRKTTTPILTDLGWIATCVGGGTVHMGGYLYRFHPDDFRMRSQYGDVEELVDWPYPYEELEPYYTLAEWEIGVAGRAGAEWPGGGRHWGYRICWPRDATPTLVALLRSGYTDEARAWREWLLRSIAGDPADLQVLYGPAGERRLPEQQLELRQETRTVVKQAVLVGFRRDHVAAAPEDAERISFFQYSRRIRGTRRLGDDLVLLDQGVLLHGASATPIAGTWVPPTRV